MSVDLPTDLAEAKKQSGAEFEFVSDSKGQLMDDFGLRHQGGHPFDGSDIPRPSILLISRKGLLVWAHYADNYRVRPTPDEVIEAALASL